MQRLLIHLRVFAVATIFGLGVYVALMGLDRVIRWLAAMVG
jgi:hypothetical protein